MKWLPSPYEDTLARRWQRRRVTLTVLAGLAGIILSLWLGRALKDGSTIMRKPCSRPRPPGGPTRCNGLVTDRVGRVSTTAAFFRSSDINDRKDFHTFVSQLTKNIPSIEMLAWAPRIPAARRNAHEEAVRKEGYSKYVISERDDRGRLIAAGKREKYYPILFTEPSSETALLAGARPGIRCGVSGRDAPGHG